MGKRKKASKPMGPKKREPLATSFACLFCNHENSVTVKLHKKEGIGQLDCRICGQTYSSNINYLSVAVDVYSDWIDACEAVKSNPEQGVSAARALPREIQAPRRTGQVSRRRTDAEDEMEDFLDNDDGGDLDGFIENDEPDMDTGYRGESP